VFGRSWKVDGDRSQPIISAIVSGSSADRQRIVIARQRYAAGISTARAREGRGKTVG